MITILNGDDWCKISVDADVVWSEHQSPTGPNLAKFLIGLGYEVDYEWTDDMEDPRFFA
jgi:hypothetical protein